MKFDVTNFRREFPQLTRRLGPNPLIYLDSAASTLKHREVCDRINVFNRFEAANVHRGAHWVSRQGTENYEAAREKVAQFINAKFSSEIVFTRGTTESLNLISAGLEEQLSPGDEILISALEHHSNIVPWQRLCERKSCVLKVIPYDPVSGMTSQAAVAAISNRTKLVSIMLYSNSLGVRLPIEELLKECRNRSIITIIDAAQAVLTESIDVQKMDCDFLAFSGHKVFGPFGIGALYGRKSWLDKLPPYQLGGSMIDRVTFDKTVYAEAPQKFEAGTPNIEGAIGLGVAIDCVKTMGLKEGHQHVLFLRSVLIELLKEIPSVGLINPQSTDYSGVLSFNLQGAHCSDVGIFLDKYGFAVRAGHHCTQPLMNILGVPGTVRVSFAPYNTTEELEKFVAALKKVETFFL